MILLLREKEVALDSALKFVDPPSTWFKRPVQHRLRSRASTCPAPGAGGEGRPAEGFAPAAADGGRLPEDRAV